MLSKKRLTGSDLIVNFWAKNGFDHVFGIPGRRILPLFDSAIVDGRVKMVVSQHEGGASFMADCFSRLTDKGCCVGISGPGAINLLTGVAAAYGDSVPMMVMCGQAQTKDQGKYAIQEATGQGRTPDQRKLFSAVTKYSETVESIEDLPQVLKRAYIEMNTGRKGPVYVELPTNILHEFLEFDPEDLYVDLSQISDSIVSAKDADIESCIDTLRLAKKPLLLIGNGARISGAEDEIKELINSTKIPFATTLLGKGLLDEDLPESLGCIGIWGQKAGNEYLLNQADTLIALGTTFQELSTLGWRSLRDKTIVRVDIDENEMFRNCEPNLPIISDVKLFCENLNSRLQRTRQLVNHFEPLQSTINELKSSYGYYETLNMDNYPVYDNEKIKPYDALKKIGIIRPKDSILVLDVGENSYFAEFLLKSHCKNTYLQNAGLGSMGYSVAGSVGAALACDKQRRVISITGDGGFLMNGNELATAAHNAANVIWCVFNNGILGTQKHYQRDFCDGRYVACDVPTFDICKFADSFGIKNHLVLTLEDLEQRFSEALDCESPTLLNIVIDENVKPLPPFTF